MRWGWMVLCCLWPRLAHAYDCAQVTDASGNPVGASLAWQSFNQIDYHFSSQGSQRLESLDAAQAAVTAAFTAWQKVQVRGNDVMNCLQDANAGSGVGFVLGGDTNQSFAGYNFLNPNSNLNVVFFRDSNWLYDSATPVMVTLTYDNLSGNIFDADIEFNTQNFNFITNLSGDIPQNAMDMGSIALYAVGTLLGFVADPSEPTSSLNANLWLNLDTNARLLACDDANAMLFRYPVGAQSVSTCNDANLCSSSCVAASTLQFVPTIEVVRSNDGFGGCQTSQTVSTQLAWAMLLALLRRGLRRRRHI